MTCQTGFFEDPRRPALAVATLLEPTGGAWGAWAFTANAYPSEHPTVDRALATALLLQGKTLGEATREALSQASDPILQQTFVLLGDPSARAVKAPSPALSTSTKTSNALGCSSAGSAAGSTALLLAVALWLASARRRAEVHARRPR